MAQQIGVHTASGPPDAARRRRLRLVGVGASVTSSFVIWVVAVPVLGVELRAPNGPGSTELEPVSVVAVVLMSLLAPLAGWALLAGLEKLTTKAQTIWTTIAVAVLVISYGGPLLGAGVPSDSRITLALMHTAVGLATILTFTRSASAR